MPIPHGVFSIVCAIPGKTASRFAWETASHFSWNCSGLRNSRQNRFALCLGKPLHTFPGIALVVQNCRSFTYMHI